jgi:hypothetical protein
MSRNGAMYFEGEGAGGGGKGDISRTGMLKYSFSRMVLRGGERDGQ